MAIQHVPRESNPAVNALYGAVATNTLMLPQQTSLNTMTSMSLVMVDNAHIRKIRFDLKGIKHGGKYDMVKHEEKISPQQQFGSGCKGLDAWHR